MTAHEERRSPLRSTSMPTEPVVEPRSPTAAPLDAQMVDLFFDRVPFGLAVFDLEGRLQRCNATWTGFYELYFGAGPDYTAPGRSLYDMIPGNEEALDQLFAAVRGGNVLRQAAHRIAIPGVTTYWDVVFAPLYRDGEIVAVLDVVTDATDRVLSTERLTARIQAFIAVASAMTVDQPLADTLATIREQVVRTTDATACSLVTWPEHPGRGPAAAAVAPVVGPLGAPTVAADPAFGPGYAEALTAVTVGRPEAPDDTTLTAVEMRRDARVAALMDAGLAALQPFWGAPTPEWDDLVVVPLVSGRVRFGEMQVHLPAGTRFAAEDADHLRAMADHAAMAVQNAALFAEQALSASLAERQRLARELHDSVSQALFSMTMHARAAQRRLEPLGADADPARDEVARLIELSRGALAEMRALIFELRPGALAEEGLAAALTRQAAAFSSREQIAVDVDAPPERLPVTAAVEEHLYRIALEAMHNAVKHARPARIGVRLSRDDTAVSLTVTDDGVGFDPERARPGHLGLGTMRERAVAVGAEFAIASTAGRGTTVRVAVPL